MRIFIPRFIIVQPTLRLFLARIDLHVLFLDTFSKENYVGIRLETATQDSAIHEQDTESEQLTWKTGGDLMACSNVQDKNHKANETLVVALTLAFSYGKISYTYVSKPKVDYKFKKNSSLLADRLFHPLKMLSESVSTTLRDAGNISWFVVTFACSVLRPTIPLASFTII